MINLFYNEDPFKYSIELQKSEIILQIVKNSLDFHQKLSPWGNFTQDKMIICITFNKSSNFAIWIKVTLKIV